MDSIIHEEGKKVQAGRETKAEKKKLKKKRKGGLGDGLPRDDKKRRKRKMVKAKKVGVAEKNLGGEEKG